MRMGSSKETTLTVSLLIAWNYHQRQKGKGSFPFCSWPLTTWPRSLSLKALSGQDTSALLLVWSTPWRLPLEKRHSPSTVEEGEQTCDLTFLTTTEPTDHTWCDLHLNSENIKCKEFRSSTLDHMKNRDFSFLSIFFFFHFFSISFLEGDGHIWLNIIRRSKSAFIFLPQVGLP